MAQATPNAGAAALLALGPFTLENTIGAGYLGCVFSSVLYGITLVLAYLYFHNYPKDWKFQKISVASLVLFDTIHLVMTIHGIYHYVILQFGKLVALLHVVWSLKVQIVLNVVIVVLVQTLYVIRVWKLGSHFSRIWPVAVVGIMIGGYVVGLLLAIYSCKLKSWVDVEAMAWVVRATFSTSTFIDAVLAVSMCYYLYKSRNSFSSTNNRIFSIIRYVLISGTLTCAASMASLFTYVAMPDNLIFLGVSFLVTKLYTISYIAMFVIFLHSFEETFMDIIRRRLNSRKSSQSGHDSSYSVGRIITGRSAAAHTGGGEEDKIGEDSLGLSSTSYRARLDQELVDQKIRPHTSSQPEVIGIKVHRTEEKKFDTAESSWSHV